MYSAGYEANHMADINNCGVGCCPMGFECLMRVMKCCMSHESMWQSQRTWYCLPFRPPHMQSLPLHHSSSSLHCLINGIIVAFWVSSRWAVTAHTVVVTSPEVVVFWVRTNIGVVHTVVNTHCSHSEATKMLGARSGGTCSRCLWMDMAVSGVGSWQRWKSECMGAMCSQNKCEWSQMLSQCWWAWKLLDSENWKLLNS